MLKYMIENVIETAQHPKKIGASSIHDPRHRYAPVTSPRTGSGVLYCLYLYVLLSNVVSLLRTKHVLQGTSPRA